MILIIASITFRRALIRAGTENVRAQGHCPDMAGFADGFPLQYYRYNVGDGIAYRWSASKREMVPDSAMSSSSTEV